MVVMVYQLNNNTITLVAQLFKLLSTLGNNIKVIVIIEINKVGE